MKKLTIAIALLPALLLGGCELQKSENPLSPSIAGPIPGVEISAPKILEPASGWQVPGDNQPLTLLVENASSTGQRPLNYAFEIATDAGFSNKVFSREGVAAGDAGRTSLRLPDALGTGRTYYWRAKAQDGANTGPYSDAVDFNLFTPLAFDKPIPISPVGNTTVASLHPDLVFTNAARVGSTISVSYGVEVALNTSFSPTMAAWQVSEQPGQTKLIVPADLPANLQIAWRVRAFDGGTVGPWSDTQVFKTPAPVVAPSPTVPTPGSCASATSHLGVVECRRKMYGYMPPDVLVQFLSGIAKDLNAGNFPGGPFGLLVKPGGNNCGGYSCDIICSSDGNIWDTLGDSEGSQAPLWAPKGSSSSACLIQR